MSNIFFNFVGWTDWPELAGAAADSGRRAARSRCSPRRSREIEPHGPPVGSPAVPSTPPGPRELAVDQPLPDTKNSPESVGTRVVGFDSSPGPMSALYFCPRIRSFRPSGTCRGLPVAATQWIVLSPLTDTADFASTNRTSHTAAAW